MDGGRPGTLRAPLRGGPDTPGEPEQGVLTIQGTISFPERSFEYRNTFDVTPEGKLIDRWFQNAFGPWRPGHVVELTAKK